MWAAAGKRAIFCREQFFAVKLPQRLAAAKHLQRRFFVVQRSSAIVDRRRQPQDRRQGSLRGPGRPPVDTSALAVGQRTLCSVAPGGGGRGRRAGRCSREVVFLPKGVASRGEPQRLSTCDGGGGELRDNTFSFRTAAAFCNGQPPPPPPSAHKSVLESANPRMDSECASGCPWSMARATARLRDSPPPE